LTGSHTPGRDRIAALAAVAVVCLLAWSPLGERLDAASGDWVLSLRHDLFGQRHPASESPTVVIGIDELTYRTEPFASTPKVMWTPQVAAVVDKVLAAGAKVVGFDVIFPTSVESYLPGFERPFLLSLRQGAQEGRIVLGKVQHQIKPVSPFPAQSMMVGNQRNIRALNVVVDVDGVIRRAPLFFDAIAGQGRRQDTSMALELAARALGTAPIVNEDGTVVLGGYRIPGWGKEFLINFQGDNDIPTYSFADLWLGVQQGQDAWFEHNFRGKVVLLGEILDLEDRKITGKRLMNGLEGGARQPPCCLAGAGAAAKQVRDTIPGVFVHAAAVNDLLRGEALREPGRGNAIGVMGLLALVTVALALRLRPLRSMVAVTLLGVAWASATVVAAQLGLVLPLFTGLGAVAVAYSLVVAYRYMVADQQKTRIRRLFSLYLAPTLVNRMVESDHLPELGGEMRQVTVWFSDLAGFTGLSEGMSPQELVAVMNTYFSAMTDIIEAHGGFVDKYIGDAIVAIFGAPVDDPRHSENAVRAALAAREKLARMNADGAFGHHTLAARVGINSGTALVGNVGSTRRFNYTVMGDTVNTASRLEGANKALGTGILVSGETAAALPPGLVLRRLGQVRVVGRQVPVEVFEPLAVEGERGAESARRLAQLFDEVNRLLLDGRYGEAVDRLAALPDDAAAMKLRGRAERLAAMPAVAWDGVTAIQEK
jgi:class 3 adenylate cyclase/CHASE2 domain-containing sensor protein